jgi:hypothetical protein
MSKYQTSGMHTEQLFPNQQGKWLPEVGMRLQLRNPRFPSTYGAWCTVVRVRGQAVTVVIDGTERRVTELQRCLHRPDLHGPLPGFDQTEVR